LDETNEVIDVDLKQLEKVDGILVADGWECARFRHAEVFEGMFWETGFVVPEVLGNVACCFRG